MRLDSLRRHGFLTLPLLAAAVARYRLSTTSTRRTGCAIRPSGRFRFPGDRLLGCSTAVYYELRPGHKRRLIRRQIKDSISDLFRRPYSPQRYSFLQ